MITWYLLSQNKRKLCHDVDKFIYFLDQTVIFQGNQYWKSKSGKFLLPSRHTKALTHTLISLITLINDPFIRGVWEMLKIIAAIVFTILQLLSVESFIKIIQVLLIDCHWPNYPNYPPNYRGSMKIKKNNCLHCNHYHSISMCII